MVKLIKRRAMAVIAALVLVFGFGLASAPIAAAGGTETSQTLVRATLGFTGGIGLKAVDGTTRILSSGSIKSSSGSTSLIQKVKAGSGYCVWEQAYRRPMGATTWTKINDYYYGQSMSSQYSDLQTFSSIMNNYKSWEYSSNLYIYSC